MEDKYDILKLQNQLCFPLYACAKEVTRHYKPFLDEFGLTYTQYIVMMVLWEDGEINVRELGRRLFLDSGTLTPVLKKLEAKGCLIRHRCAEDERSVILSLTDAGRSLRDSVLCVPGMIGSCMHLEPEEARTLYNLLYKLLGSMEDTPPAGRGGA